MLRSKQCGKHWESSTHTYSLSTYSVQATVHLNPQNFQDSVSALNYSEEGGGMPRHHLHYFVSTSAVGKGYFNIKMPRNYHIKWKIRARERLFV